MSDLQQIPLTTIDGQAASLGDHAGKVLLVVNVASKCGLTPQYTALEQLYEDWHDEGFEVLGFPANNFGAQEPGTDAEIAEFCSTTYDVQFPMFSKISVVGDFRERLRSFGMTPTDDPDILWNFEKFVVAKDGTVVRRFAPSTTPDDRAVVAAIEEELAK